MSLFSSEDEATICYGGALKLFYNDSLHTYWSVKNNEAVVYPSLTTVLSSTIDKSAPLMQWAVNQCLDRVAKLLEENPNYPIDKLIADSKFAFKDTSTQATDTGTLVHNWIDDYWSSYGKYPPIPSNDPDAERSIYAFLEWTSKHEIEPLLVERICVSRKYGFAGRCDWLGYIDGNLVIADWKSSKRLYNTYNLQLAGYVRAIKEEIASSKYILVGSKKVYFPYDKQINRMVVRLGKDGKLEYNHLTDKKELKADINALLHAVSLHKWLWMKDLSNKKLAVLQDIKWTAKFQEKNGNSKLY